MRELIDVLDLLGCRTGQTCLRSDAHKLGYWHATVHIFVYRFRENELQLLVHLRSQSKDLYPDTFDPVFGGHVQSGSEPIATACEELSGEIGITVVASQLQQGPVLMADKGLDKEFNHLFA